MKLHTLSSTTVLCLATALLAGCSGSDGTELPSFEADTGVVNVTAVSIDNVSENSNSTSGTINLATNEVSLANNSGALDADRTKLELATGGTGTLTSNGATYARFLEVNPTNGPRRTGVIGIDSPSLPTGSGVYTGTGNLTIQDNLDVLDLNGTVTVTANFDDGTVDTAYTDLNGTRDPAFSQQETVTNAGTLRVDGSQISSTGFSGGTTSLDIATVNNGQPLSGQAQTNVSGAFYGPSADEVGAAFVVDDLTANGVSIRGAYIAD